MEPATRAPRLVPSASEAPDDRLFGAGELGRSDVFGLGVAASDGQTRMGNAVHASSPLIRINAY